MFHGFRTQEIRAAVNTPESRDELEASAEARRQARKQWEQDHAAEVVALNPRTLRPYEFPYDLDLLRVSES